MVKRRKQVATAVLVLVSTMLPTAGVADSPMNLLANGGLENDADNDGVPDGWVSHPHHFSRETMGQVQEHITNMPTHQQMLAAEHVEGSDGWILFRREADGTWGPYIKSAQWYQRMANEYLPQNSRFGQLPLPADLDLGNTTMVIHNLPPHEQTISEPIPVKPNTGYRLSFWFRMGGGSEEAIFQILGSRAPRNDAWPTGASKDNRHLITYLNLGWSWVPYWRRYEIAFRTAAEETEIRLRPWKYFRGYDDARRAWFDDFCLVEDDSVRVGGTGGPANPPAAWPEAVMNRGFTVVPRPTMPLTYNHFEPLPDQIDQPLVITAAPGQYASAVLFIKAVKDLSGPLVVGPKGRPQLNGPDGMYLWMPNLVEFRVCHPLQIKKSQQQWELRPHYLMPGARETPIREYTRTVEVNVPKGEGRSVWVTAFVPDGTPPGDYRGEIHVVAEDKDYVGYDQQPGPNDGHAIPFTVRVRDLRLLEPDAAFGMYAHTGREGKSVQLPVTVDHRGYLDQHRHGMTAVDQGGSQVWRYKDKKGKVRINFSAFDHDMKRLVAAGFTRAFHYYPYNDAMEPEVQLAILQHCREKGYPEPLFYAFDEPGAQGADLLPLMEKQFGEARRQGLRTVTAGLDWRTQGEAYDVWILDVSQIGSKEWPQIKSRAARLGSELWAYDCSTYINTHPENIRFYTGLWTWAAGLKGNWIWEYGAGIPSSQTHAFSLSDTTPPTKWVEYGFAFSIPSGWAASTSWEARRQGVNDFRYLQTLERAISLAAESGQPNLPAAIKARRYLDRLRARVPLDAFSYRNRDSTAYKQFQSVAPAIAPAEYDTIQQACATHTIAIHDALP